MCKHKFHHFSKKLGGILRTPTPKHVTLSLIDFTSWNCVPFLKSKHFTYAPEPVLAVGGLAGFIPPATILERDLSSSFFFPNPPNIVLGLVVVVGRGGMGDVMFELRSWKKMELMMRYDRQHIKRDNNV